MEFWKKFTFVLAMMAVVLAATMPPTASAARKEEVTLPADLSSTTTSAKILDVKHKPDEKCLKNFEFCMFTARVCCENCACLGLCLCM
ncbi:hypothetical protein J1N35_016737 [Gossypium stocksii]|uniref:Uncharacterized protein n=1 Tax=Gossypium stocksii TaxID=47602 RepID=A0A9D3VMY1_9ROSI|nr:hypothetical protein J1N35_016737 [Gossypium stocksii]